MRYLIIACVLGAVPLAACVEWIDKSKGTYRVDATGAPQIGPQIKCVDESGYPVDPRWRGSFDSKMSQIHHETKN